MRRINSRVIIGSKFLLVFYKTKNTIHTIIIILISITTLFVPCIRNSIPCETRSSTGHIRILHNNWSNYFSVCICLRITKMIIKDKAWGILYSTRSPYTKNHIVHISTTIAQEYRNWSGIILWNFNNKVIVFYITYYIIICGCSISLFAFISMMCRIIPVMPACTIIPDSPV